MNRRGFFSLIAALASPTLLGAIPQMPPQVSCVQRLRSFRICYMPTDQKLRTALVTPEALEGGRIVHLSGGVAVQLRADGILINASSRPIRMGYAPLP